MATRKQVSEALEPVAPNGNGNSEPPIEVVVREAITRQSSAFQAVLPAHVDSDRFARLVLTACKSTPELMACFNTAQGKMSVLVAAMQSAALGLEPNTPAEEAWLLPSNNKGADGKNRMEARLHIGYKGYLKLARESGEISKIVARCVREGDHFEYEYGINERLVHRPAPSGERGDLLYVYAIAWYTSGAAPQFDVLDRDAVHARRAMSQSYKSKSGRPYSPWTTNTESMWEKSGIRKLAHMLPRTPKLNAAMAADEAQLTFDESSGEIMPSRPELEPGADVDEIDVPPVDDGEVNENSAYDLIDLAKLHGLIPDNASAGGARKALMTIGKDAAAALAPDAAEAANVADAEFGADADAMAEAIGPIVADYIRSKGGE